ncbi:NADH:flavin oxidoreductase [Piscinibacter sp. XHJ-5]|uniref:NADH:flavin oxidoreductase n=1 Tax=Piscinibacter sp. XHJ-5 TaxID=3037797 RepID=UPI00245339AE|nr:NADH:flavin oxidoreductase [Piscinibacter sp. XHJ-5]
MTRTDVEPLFVPLSVRGLALPNRIVMAPMTRNFSPRGVPGDDVAAYYRRRAEGGCGLLITEGVGIDHPAALGDAGLGESHLPHLFGADALAGWKRVVDGVHAAGGKVIPQLWHQGVMREPGTGPFPDVPTLRPSGLWGPAGRTTSLGADYVERVIAPTRAMTESEIQDVIDAYAHSARHARDVGFDGIAVHGAHGYLIDTFLWDETNRRVDAWGGDRRARSRFAAEVVRSIRREVGDAMPIFFRFSQWKQQDFKARLANTPQELEDVLGPIADAGVDVFDGSVRYFDRAEFDGSPLNLSGWARKITGKLAMAIGGIGLDRGFYDSRRDGRAGGADNIELLMARFNRGEFDLVAVGRALLNEPAWTRLLRHGHELPAFDEAKLQVLH